MTNLDYLVSSAKLGNLSHAYLLSGNDKEAKEKTLISFLVFLLGKGERHGDLHTVDPEKKGISIGKIRDLELELALSSWNSPWKVAVIRNAHLMNQEAQSALLKLLEEPKGNTLFFLETDHPFQLLATIRSRTQEIRFWKFPSLEEQVSEEMRKKFALLATQPLTERFAQAKTLSESQEETQQFLEECIAWARGELFENLHLQGIRLPSLLELAGLLQETSSLLKTTNANPRLLLERLFLHLSF